MTFDKPSPSVSAEGSEDEEWLKDTPKPKQAEPEAMSPETAKETAVLKRYAHWYKTGVIDAAEFKEYKKKVLDGSLKRSGFGEEETETPAPPKKRRKTSDGSRARVLWATERHLQGTRGQ